ncbi:MAG: formylglycine-generating enzyme family protein [Muribaculaceae bacterium]|nr:formylglycine-generating enzyme family protein [Muribaculaceae bacterium]
MLTRTIKCKGVFMVAFLLIACLSNSCSKGDNSDLEALNPDKPYLGSWRIDYDDSEIIFLVFGQEPKFTYYCTDQNLLSENKYESKADGSYTYDSEENLLRCHLDGETFYVSIVGQGSNTRLEIDGDIATRVKSTEVPKNSIDGSTEEEEKPTNPSGRVSVTTLDCKQTEQLRATFHCKVAGASQNAEIGFYLGFSSNFGRETYRKISITGGNGNISIETKGIYGEQKYYYRAYVIDGGKEYLGAVKSFVSLPIEYTINGRSFKPVLIKDGPYGDFCILQTEIPADESFKIDEYIFKPMDENGNGECTAYEVRTFIADLANRTGLPWRCPTTVEWQMAYRGGYASKGYKYSGSNDIDEVAWYYSNSRAKMHEVGTKAPNELSLYDMSGNLSEPVNDYQTKYFASHDYLAFQSMVGIFATNKMYGGNFISEASECTVNSSEPSEIRTDVFDTRKTGFRFVYSVDPAFIPYTN